VKVGVYSNSTTETKAYDPLGNSMKDSCILLVEDNDNDIVLFKEILHQAGIFTNVFAVGTADEAIRYLSGEQEFSDRSSYPMPRLILVDLKLPGKSGHEVLRWMRQQPELGNIVRVVLTGSPDQRDRKVAYELGANCYLQKPLTIEQLTGPSRSIRMLFGGNTDPIEMSPSAV